MPLLLPPAALAGGFRNRVSSVLREGSPQRPSTGKPVLLPPAAIGGDRGIPGAIYSYDAAQQTTVMYENDYDPHDAPHYKAGDFLIPEGAHRGDFLEFYCTGESFHSAYEVGEKIGEGGFGKVFRATHKHLNIARAVKRLKKSKSKSDMHKHELAALLALDHPHIIKLIEFYDEEQYLYLVFELCGGPDLLDRIQGAQGGRMTEYDASVALRHMLKALQCCHSQYRGHYDIKPENFMFANQDCTDLMMIDLGLSSGFDRQRRHKIKGTAAYMAPEFWDGIYGPEGDIWSCGVVLFVMLTGQEFLPDIPPAILKRETRCRRALVDRLRSAADQFKLSREAQDLLRKMLQHDRHARPTVREALNHQFNMSSYENERMHPKRFSDPRFKEALNVRERLHSTWRAVAKEPVLKRVARLAMAHSCDVCVQELAAERFVFRMLDRHGYGELSISVVENDFTFRGAVPPEDLEVLFESMDLNRDGYISYSAFLATMIPFSLRTNENLCRVAFSILDRGKDGFIDDKDLACVFGHEQGSDTCKTILAEVCPNGQLSWVGFLQLMNGDLLM